MNDQIKTVLIDLKSTVPAAEKLVVNIEKPLPSGLRLEAHAETADGEISVRVRDARAFFNFTKNYQSQQPWNRMTLILDKDNIVEVKTLFDLDLQKKTEERIK